MFKRFISILTVVSLLSCIISASLGATAAYEENIIYGDLDGDKEVKIEDARIVLKLAAGVKAPSKSQLARADINFDGKITIFDARQILRGAVGLASLQPSGAFKGFDGGDAFESEENLVEYFNGALNKIKNVSASNKKSIAATITKVENDKLLNFDIKTVELPAFSFGTSAEGIASMVEEHMTEDDKENIVTVIPFGSQDFSAVSVENEDYVSDLSVSDIYGSRASYDSEAKEITIEIALPDTEIETAMHSAYSKVMDTSAMIEEQDSTLLKLMGSTSGGGAMFRQFKDCVLTVVVDVESNKHNVKSYKITYQSNVYVAQASFSSLANLKGITIEKEHTIDYESFIWNEK